MILVKTTGDLGNLMFQYAFGFTTARRLKTSFCLNRLRELTFFELGGDTAAANALRKLRFKLAALTRRPVEKRWLDFNDGRYAAPETVLADLGDHAIYRGYFQSSRYYAGLESEVKSLFRVKEELRRRFEQHYADHLQGPPLGVLHLRGKGHGEWDRIRLPWSYYENCLERVRDRESYRWLVVTDDVDYARRNLPPTVNMEIVSDEVIDDFQLMTRATIHLMANSSFSWWAAYLNPNPAARIMAPKYWYGHKPEYQFEAPEGITHPAWEVGGHRRRECGGSMSRPKMSVGRRLQRLVAGALPGQLRWRGFRLAAGEIELRRLDPAYYPPGGAEEKRGLPENFDPQRDEAVFRIDGGYATDHGATLTSSGFLLRELSREWNPQPHGHTRLQKPVWRPRVHRVAEAASITLEHNANYCHFLFEGLPRLRILRRCHPDPSIPVYANTKKPFQRELLPLFGVGPERLIPAADFPLLQAQRLWAPTYPGRQGKFTPEAIGYLRETLLLKLEAAAPLRPLSRRIYVSRRDATSRRILNEAEIERRLKAAGFECLCLGEMPVLDQLRAFAEARVVVAAHGASLTNIAFADAGALMVEIFPEDFFFDCYQELAGKVGVKGIHFKAPSVSVGEGGLAQDLTIPEALYDQILAALKIEGIV